MIKELIAKHKEEAAAEADHKQWCDQQLMENKNKRNKKTSESEKLMAEIDEMNANIDTGDTCAQNCAAGAVDQKTWEGTYGVKQNGNGVDVGFVTQGPYSVNVGSR